MEYNKLIGIISFNHDDFMSWLEENNIIGKPYRGKLRSIISGDILYYEISNPFYLCWITCNDFFITERGKENPKFNIIIDTMKPTLMYCETTRNKINSL